MNDDAHKQVHDEERANDDEDNEVRSAILVAIKFKYEDSESDYSDVGNISFYNR